MPSWIRTLLLSSTQPANPKKPTQKRLRFDSLEERIAPAGGLTYAAISPAPLTVRLSGNTVEVINTVTSGVLASKALVEIDAGVKIDGNGFNVTLTVDDSLPLIAGGVQFLGGSGESKIVGPDSTTSWTITGAGSGTLAAALTGVSLQVWRQSKAARVTTRSH